ncbi:hypothetical protein ES288_D02G091100v1 [Gossypium darwinii]|uniref:Uncharacterized protein n=1 Tax=Gossypium darwinii TaxID=34276 RepID=A0A5D2DE88_GOSDA|nr:hypothetical protein ES288_D02G091100v1 [Gossypium darwinii]
MENQPPVKDFGKLPLIEEPEPKTLSKDQYKQAQSKAKGEASTSATQSDEAAAGTQPKVPFPWPA